jgi:demethoxyubiquinone hydroxylase (CLK1/Coq7/Cat5 family)
MVNQTPNTDNPVSIRPADIHPDEWVEEKVVTGKQRLLEARDEIESAVVAHPLRAVAIGFGIGYVSRSLPLVRGAVSAVRLVLPLVPYALLAVGAARAWEILSSERNRALPFTGGTPGPAAMDEADVCIAACNKLLRGELSAIETYSQAIARFGTGGDRGALRHLLAVHEDSASRLRQHIAEMGGQPSFEAGVWGDFAQALEGTALVLGASPALAILQAGEEHGVREYEAALDDPAMMEDIKGTIRQHNLPRAHENVNTLLRLKATEASVL